LENEYLPIGYAELSLMGLPLILLLALYARLGIAVVRKTLHSVFRMMIQLTAAGAALVTLFRWNEPWLNFIIFVAMVLFAAQSVSSSASLSLRRYGAGLAAGMFLSVFPLGLFTAQVVLHSPQFMDIRYFTVLAGMILGNMLRSAVVAHSHFFKELKNSPGSLEYRLSLGASPWEAVKSLFARSLSASMEPQLAAMMTTGIVFLPGMMTGQILSGISPIEAVRYQILIMLLIFSGAGFGGALSLYFSWKASLRAGGKAVL